MASRYGAENLIDVRRSSLTQEFIWKVIGEGDP